MTEPQTTTPAPPIGRPFEPGHEKTGGRQTGTANHVPSARKLKRRLLRHLNDMLERHPDTIETLRKTDPVAAARADLQLTRDSIEILGRLDEFAGPQRPRGARDAEITARAEALGPVSEMTAAEVYLRMISLPAGSDEERLLFARSALSERKRIDQQLEAIAAGSGCTVEQVRAVLTALGPVLEPLKAATEKPAQSYRRTRQPRSLRPAAVALQESASAIELTADGQLVVTVPPIPPPPARALEESEELLALRRQQAFLRGY